MLLHAQVYLIPTLNLGSFFIVLLLSFDWGDVPRDSGSLLLQNAFLKSKMPTRLFRFLEPI